MSNRRIWNEIQLWRIQWQQVDTFVDRLESARDDDHPHALRCKALHDAAAVAERLGQRRGLPWLRNHQPLVPGATGVNLIAPYPERRRSLPGAFDLEAAVAGLGFENDALLTDEPAVLLIGSEELFALWDPVSQRFLPLVVPDYGFGRLGLASPRPPHPFIAGLSLQDTHKHRIGESATSDDSLFSVPRRRVAAEEGFVDLKTWSALRAERWALLLASPDADQPDPGQTDFRRLPEALAQRDDLTALSITLAAKAMADADLETLRTAMEALMGNDAEDEAIASLRALLETIVREQRDLVTASALLRGHLSLLDRARVERLLRELPTPSLLLPTLTALHSQLDEAIEARIAYPDGTLRTVRVIETALLRMWRSRLPWFRQRDARVLAPLLNRFLGRFEASLTGLLSGGGSGFPLTGTRTAMPVVALAEQLPLVADPTVDLSLVRPGQLAVLGGARPALAVVLGASTSPVGAPRLEILPLRVSQAQTLGLDGVPGLVEAEAPLRSALTTPLTGEELRRGRRDGEQEADAIPQEVVALWSRLKLLRGDACSLRLPAPFDDRLSLPVQATAERPLAAGANRLLVITDAFDATQDPPQPLFATPGELLLLRGRDAEGGWWQGVVEVAGAVVTTLEAEQATPVLDPESPLCCEPETPVVLVLLSQNSLTRPLVDQVRLHRRFLGFTWPGLVVGRFLPSRLDPLAPVVAVTSVGAGTVRFDETTAAATLHTTGQDFVDRGPELAAAAQLLDRWVGRR